MTLRRTARGNTITFEFEFEDDEGNTANVTSATLQLTYPGQNDFVTEVLTLTEGDNDVWAVTWDSSKSRAGWAEYHAHAIAGVFQYTEDGRFRLTGNRANMDHDALPASGTASTSALSGPGLGDYGQ